MTYKPPHNDIRAIAENTILDISPIQNPGFIHKSIHKLTFSSKELSNFRMHYKTKVVFFTNPTFVG